MVKKEYNENLSVAMLGILALALVGVFYYSFLIIGETPITGQVVLEEAIEEEPVACTADYNPVCGVDGRTYSNLCIMELADVKLNYEGECLFADVIYFGGSVFTMDNDFPEYIRAVAIRNEEIIYLGSEDDVLDFQGGDTVMEDLRGGPLFIELVEGSFTKVKSAKALTMDAINEERGVEDDGVIDVDLHLSETPSEERY